MTENATKPIKIALADDHLFFRTGFKNILQSQDRNNEMAFAGEAANGLELIDLVGLHRPHIVITDIKMPVMDGIEATRIIKDRFPATRVIALSALEDANTVMSMFQAGAGGYLVKNTTWEEVIDAIKKVHDGKPYYCSTISDKVYGKFTPAKMQRNKNKPIQFSIQETNVIKLICKEFTTKEIASTLTLHTRTIEDCRRRIQEKTGARNVVGIALYALMHEIIRLSEL